jgi:hypothetical protein
MKRPKVAKGEIIAKAEIVDRAKIESHVSKFRLFARRTAEAFIETARTIIVAEKELNKDEYTIFCEEVGIQKGTPFYKKMHVIGKRADRFASVSESLPDNWTTLYLLSSLSDEDFESVLDAKLIGPMLKASELAKFLTARDAAIGKRPKSYKPPTEITLILRGVDEEKLPDIFSVIAKWKDDTGLKVIGGDGFLPN